MLNRKGAIEKVDSFIDRDYFAGITIKNEYMLIETKTYPTDYFEKGDPFIDEIKKTGIEIKI